MTIAAIAVLLAGTVLAEPVIVPAVQQWHGAQGSFDPHGAPIVIAAKDEKLLRPTAEEIVGEKP